MNSYHHVWRVLKFLSLTAFVLHSGGPALIAQPSNPRQVFAASMSHRLAAQYLKRIDADSNGDLIESKIWALLDLRLPLTSNLALKTSMRKLTGEDKAFFEAAIAELQSEQREETSHMLSDYVAAAGSSNRLYSTHLANLGIWGGEGVVTNFPGTTRRRGADPFFRELGRRLVLIKLSARGLGAACANDACSRLVQDLRVAAEFRRQAFWKVVILLSSGQPDESLSVEILLDGTSITTSTMKYHSPDAIMISGEDDSEIQRSIERLILEVWYQQLK